MTKGEKKQPTGDYEVGYARPPDDTKFKKGQPRPPRKAKEEPEKSIEEYFAEELKVMVTLVDEEGRKRTMPKEQVMVRAAINKAVKTGDLRKIGEYLPRRQATGVEQFSEADLELIARFLAQWQGGSDEEGDSA